MAGLIGRVARLATGYVLVAVDRVSLDPLPIPESVRVALLTGARP